ncbi:MAG: polysaccharide biosynthesis/export family protein [Hyphomicrobiaceae bacterium]
MRQNRLVSFRWPSIAIAGLSLALVSGCVGTDANAPWADLGAMERTGHADPKLSPGDELRITVFEEKDLSGQFRVATNGTVSLPLVGPVRAAGTTVDDFRELLRTRLASGYLKNPRVAVEVLSYKPIFIHGEVRSGGEFPFKIGLTFRDAIAIAGGYSYRADERYVLLTRSGSREPVRVSMPSAAPLLPGDNIRIPERFF